MNETPKPRLPDPGRRERGVPDPYAFLAAVLTTCAIVVTFCLILITIAVIKTQIEITQFLDGDAWNAPWLNIIERGPIE